MADRFTISTTLEATPRRVYTAWMSSKDHSAFTGDTAKIAARVGGAHSEFSGYITGKTLELEPYRRIVQSWRTTEFPDGSPDSRLELILEDRKGKTRLTLIHSGIPDGQGPEYNQGWKDNYFVPMAAYFKAE
ncbi:MAG TPA: SRPBCC domain-containing protein [Anaerolineales bacterium]|nr:SRPBCC domain-containing protein [Anaerolineales bacterium]